VRDHLNGGAQIIAAPLLGDDVLVDPPVVMLSDLAERPVNRS
jgi:hypothetical protein